MRRFAWPSTLVTPPCGTSHGGRLPPELDRMTSTAAASYPASFVMRLAMALALALALAARPVLAAPSGFAFLEIPAGARNAALGGAQASITTGPEAMYANPA